MDPQKVSSKTFSCTFQPFCSGSMESDLIFGSNKSHHILFGIFSSDLKGQTNYVDNK